jgi:hypothetical protein
MKRNKNGGKLKNQNNNTTINEIPFKMPNIFPKESDKKSLNRTIINVKVFIEYFIYWIIKRFKLMVLLYFFLFLVFMRDIIKASDWMIMGNLFQSYMLYLPKWIEIGTILMISSGLSIIVLMYVVLKCFKDAIIEGNTVKYELNKNVNTSFILLPGAITTIVLTIKTLYPNFHSGQYVWMIPVIFCFEILLQLILLIVVLSQIDWCEKYCRKYLLLIMNLKTQ